MSEQRRSRVRHPFLGTLVVSEDLESPIAVFTGPNSFFTRIKRNGEGWIALASSRNRDDVPREGRDGLVLCFLDVESLKVRQRIRITEIGPNGHFVRGVAV